MLSPREILLAPAVWLSDRLNFTLKYGVFGLGIALVVAYLSIPLFSQVNQDIAMSQRQLEGVNRIAAQNHLFIRLVAQRRSLAWTDQADAKQAVSPLTDLIDEVLKQAKQGDEASLAADLGRVWGRARAMGADDPLADRFAAFNNAVTALLTLSRESARAYRLNLDPDLDAAFDMMVNRLPAVIDTATKQNQVIQWDLGTMGALATSAQVSLNEAIPTMRDGVNQLSAQTAALQARRREASLLPSDGQIGANPPTPLPSQLRSLLSGLAQQQDSVDQVRDTQDEARASAKEALRVLAHKNAQGGQDLLVDAASAARAVLNARIERLHQDRMFLALALAGSGLLLIYLLYAFYVGVLQSIQAISQGTNAFCAGQRGIRIELTTRDELSLVASNFNTMAQEAERLVHMIEKQNESRERDLKVLIEAVGQKNEELYAVNQRVNEELNLARNVQLAILPQQFPDEPTWAVHACMHPARELGGDFYDCFVLPDGRHGVLVADVSGKGVGAAFFMAVSRTVLLDSALSVRAPAQVLALANDLLCARNPMQLFVTACYGLFDPQTGNFEYASAGHQPPLVRRQQGWVETLATTKDMALGVLTDMHYSEHRTQLLPGDTLLMYTDGVTEAFSPQNQAYGTERLGAWFANIQTPHAAASLVDDLVGDVARFVNGAEASDDLTCLILCHKPSDGPRLDFAV